MLLVLKFKDPLWVDRTGQREEWPVIREALYSHIYVHPTGDPAVIPLGKPEKLLEKKSGN